MSDPTKPAQTPPLAAAPGSAFRDELHALVNAHASKIGPQEAAFWLASMAHSALVHLVWMPAETRQAKELLAKSCDLLPLPNSQDQRP